MSLDFGVFVLTQLGYLDLHNLGVNIQMLWHRQTTNWLNF
jgi:hypothetical protein